MLVLRYKDRLYSTLLRLCGTADDALDVLQNAFLRAYQKLDQFHGDSSFYTWIHRIAVNLALSERRRRKPAAGLAEGGANQLVDSADDQERTDPSAPLERLERERLVRQALGELAPDYRAVVVLKDLEGLRYEEIAETLGIPVGTVRSRLHRGRCELRAKLAPLFEDHAGENSGKLGRGETCGPPRPRHARLGLNDPP
jgi:RNA polymerase sigma-70 factor (ECF subfamily)